ncbi:MAG TPA: type II CAAX endopeptidase family protein [Planctomycetota bacterium]|nr:type II CAAX endopeptidase family protein [Planctomycetota bacterium]
MTGAIEPAEIPSLLLALTGVVPLAVLVRRHRAGRPPLLAGEPPFRKVDPEIPLLVAGTLFLLYAAGALQAALGAFGPAGAAAAILVLAVAGVAAAILARRIVLRPRGTAIGRIGMGLLVFWAVLPVVFLTFLACRKLGLPEQAQVDVLRKRGEGWIPLALSAVLVAPVVEEACFRGLFYPALRQRFPVRWAISVTSIAFAAVHPPTVWLPLAIFAAALAWLVETTGSVLPAIAAHMALNGLTVGTVLLGG